MVDLNKLKEEQLKLAKKVITTDSAEKITTIAGADQAYVGDKVISAIAVCDYKSLEVIFEGNYSILEGNAPALSLSNCILRTLIASAFFNASSLPSIMR